MSIRATYVADSAGPIDITIGPHLDHVAAKILEEIHGHCRAGVLECREHDKHPAFAAHRDEHGRVHKAWCYVQKRNGKWVICHHRDGIAGGLGAHEVPAGMSDQHRWQQDYYQRAAQDAGHHVEQEFVTTTDVRVDVLIRGAIDVGIEVQHSALSLPKVRARTRAAGSAGITAIWSADRDNPDFAFKVPHVETNQLPHGLAPRGSWTVTTGPRSLRVVACTARNTDLLPKCTKPRARNWCGEDHAVWRPMHGVIVDHIAARAPAGELVALDTRTRQGVILVSPSDRDAYLANFAPVRTPEQHAESSAQPCGYRPSLKQLQIEPPWHRPRPCPSCGNESRAIVDQRCLRCRLAAGIDPFLHR